VVTIAPELPPPAPVVDFVTEIGEILTAPPKFTTPSRNNTYFYSSLISGQGFPSFLLICTSLVLVRASYLEQGKVRELLFCYFQKCKTK
jgi:hypothetical protein